jgi:hypothetical protein
MATQFTDAVDTYYAYVKSRIVTAVLPESEPGAGDGVPALNPLRVFGGTLEAAAWPPSDVKDGAIYLNIQNQFPGKRGTLANREYRHVLQWTWLTRGTDISQGGQGANRGDRFRLDQEIRAELYQANFPQFCPLVTVTFDQASGTIVRTPYNPIQMCRWTPLSFGPRPAIADSSGVLYGAAAVDVFAFQQSISQ